MTDPDTARLVRELPLGVKAAFLQLPEAPKSWTALPSKVLLPMLRQGLVNMVDGNLAISDKGLAVIAHLEGASRRAARERFVRLVETALEHEVPDEDLELTFRTHFTTSELAGIDPSLAAVRRALLVVLDESREEE